MRTPHRPLATQVFTTRAKNLIKIKTKFLKIVMIQSDAGVIVDDEQMEVVEHFKLGPLKPADGNCSKDTRSRIRMAKKIRLDLVPI